MPTKSMRHRNKMPIKKTRRLRKKPKSQKINKKKSNKKAHKSRQQNIKKNKKTRKLVQKYFEWDQQQQKTVPGLGVAKQLIKESIKELKKKNKKTQGKAALKLTMAVAILSSYAPIEQKMDIGRLGTKQSGIPGAISDPNVLVKYHNPIVNPNNSITFSNRELKHMRQHLPELYSKIVYN